MSYVDDLRNTMTDMLNRAETEVEQTIQTAPAEIRRAIHRVADSSFHGAGRLIPDYVVDGVADLVIEAALAALNDCLARIAVYREAVAFMGSPDNLRKFGQTLETMGHNAENLQIQKDYLDGYLTWDDGIPSETYALAIDAQVEALARVDPALTGVKEVLRTHADDIESFYLDLLAAVGGLVVAVGGVVAAILSLIAGALTFETGAGPIIGIIGAALSLVVSLGGLVVSAIGAVQFIVAVTQGASAKLDAMDAEMVDWAVPRFAQIQ